MTVFEALSWFNFERLFGFFTTLEGLCFLAGSLV